MAPILEKEGEGEVITRLVPLRKGDDQCRIGCCPLPVNRNCNSRERHLVTVESRRMAPILEKEGEGEVITLFGPTPQGGRPMSHRLVVQLPSTGIATAV